MHNDTSYANLNHFLGILLIFMVLQVFDVEKQEKYHVDISKVRSKLNYETWLESRS